MVMSSTRITQETLLPLLLIVVLGLNVTHIDGSTISSTSLLPGRNLVQTDNGNVSGDTVRVDPLDRFREYRGGFDITNKHYWSSTIFTGVYGYSIGVLWLVSGALYGCFLIATTLPCKRSNKRKLRKRSLGYIQSHPFPILLPIFFTILAMVGSGMVIGGNVKFHSEANSVVNIIIETANNASETMLKTSAAMTSMKNNLEASNGSVDDVSLFLSSTSHRLEAEAANIEMDAMKNRRSINKGLEIVYIVTSMIMSVNLIAAIALSVTGILRLPRALNSLIVLCWLLTTLCWFSFGLYFFLERFSTDTCTALESFKENPNNNSLSSILPCKELLSAKPLLFEVSSGIYDLVNEVNANISLQTTFSPMNVRVCNPFSAPPEYEYQPENCPANSIRIGDIPKALKVLACSDANDGTCQGGLISNTELQAVEAYTSSIEEVLNTYPGMEGLVECESVKDGFAEILNRHCKPLRRHVRLVWAGLVFLSVVMVVLVLTWMMIAQQYKFSDGSVKNKTHSVTASVMESGLGKEVQEDLKPSSVL